MSNEFKITIDGIRELADAINRLAVALAGPKAGGQAQGENSVQTQPPTMQQRGMQPATYNFSQAPAVPVAPMAQPPLQGTGQTVSGPVVPTTAMAQGYTIEQLQVAAAGLSSMGKMQQVVGILQRFGIQAMTELPKERYGDFAIALREAGAQI